MAAKVSPRSRAFLRESRLRAPPATLEAPARLIESAVESIQRTRYAQAGGDDGQRIAGLYGAQEGKRVDEGAALENLGEGLGTIGFYGYILIIDFEHTSTVRDRDLNSILENQGNTTVGRGQYCASRILVRQSFGPSIHQILTLHRRFVGREHRFGRCVARYHRAANRDNQLGQRIGSSSHIKTRLDQRACLHEAIKRTQLLGG